MTDLEKQLYEALRMLAGSLFAPDDRPEFIDLRKAVEMTAAALAAAQQR